MPNVDQAWAPAVNAAAPFAVKGSGQSYGSLSVSSATETSIGTAGVSVKALGTTTAGLLQDFTAVGDNRLRYDGSQTAVFEVQVHGSAIGTNAQVLELSIAKGGSNIESTAIQRKTGTGADVGAFSTGCIVELAEGEYVELFVANNTTNANLTIQKMVMTVVEVS